MDFQCSLNFPELSSCKVCNLPVMLLLVMHTPPTNSDPVQPPNKIRLDPCRSRIFAWLEWDPDAPEFRDDRGRLLQPAGPCLNVRFRGNGAEWSHWPVSESEARLVMNPGAIHDYSIGHAYGSIIKAHKSSRAVKLGERQATKQQREEAENRAGRRWLA